jgi:peptidoglycan biosynthesis protein MviN/MurJ (putative lipid II flippase)
MNPKRFLAGLGITVLVQAGLSYLLVISFQLISNHLGFILSTILAMVVFSLMMYVAARVAADSKLTRLYIQLVMIAVFMKMLVCLALVIGYKKGFDPVDNTFVWPFLIIYVTSTIYEVTLLEKVGRQKKTTLP